MSEKAPRNRTLELTEQDVNMNLKDQKILNAIKYFVKHTKNVGRTKLFKLLFFWDFYYFEKHGKSITGLIYYTYPFGPVPKNIYDGIKNENLPEYYYKHLLFEEDDTFDELDEFKRFKVLLRDKKVDMEVFTPYEKEELEKVTDIFKYATATDMTEASHFHNKPWRTTIDSKGKFQSIDYLLAKSEDTPFDDQEIKERMELRKQRLQDEYS